MNINLILSTLSQYSDQYSILVTIIAIFLFIWGMYSKIKYLCLKKASEKVAEIENLEDISGEEKFALVVKWIDDELPRIFRNSLFKSIIQSIVQFAYDNSFAYMKRYVKRKTGRDISIIVDGLKSSGDATIDAIFGVEDPQNPDTKSDKQNANDIKE